MFDDLEDGSHLGLWAAAGLLVLLLLGLAGGLWVQQHRASQKVALLNPPQGVSSQAPAARVDLPAGMQLR